MARATQAPISRRAIPTYVGLTTGVAAVSFAAVLIRQADAPALVIAAYRLGLATLVLVPATLIFARRQLFALGRRQLLLLVLAGCFLAVHFASWIGSLGLTSVASSVVLVTATPLMVAVASRSLFHEPLTRRVLSGIALGLVGSAVIASGDLRFAGRDELMGDGLAVLGAVAMTAYLLVGRKVRADVPVLPYVSVVYATSAALLLAGALLSGGSLTGYSGKTYLMFGLLAVVPQVVGHSLLNWSLSRVTATVVSVSVMAEPIASTVAAYLVLDETPPATSLIGGAIILAGIFIALKRHGKTGAGAP